MPPAQARREPLARARSEAGGRSCVPIRGAQERPRGIPVGTLGSAMPLQHPAVVQRWYRGTVLRRAAALAVPPCFAVLLCSPCPGASLCPGAHRAPVLCSAAVLFCAAVLTMPWCFAVPQCFTVLWCLAVPRCSLCRGAAWQSGARCISGVRVSAFPTRRL